MSRIHSRFTMALASAIAAGATLGTGVTIPQVALASDATDASLAQSPQSSAAEVEFVGSTAQARNASSTSVAVPATVKAGDTLLLTAALSNTSAVQVPSGWRLVRNQNSNATSSLRGALWAKTATSSDAGSSVGVKLDAVHKSAVALSAYRGLADSAGVTAAVRTSAKTSAHQGPDIAVEGAARVVSVWMDKGPSTTKWDIPLLETRAAVYSSGDGRVSVAVADGGANQTGQVSGSTAKTNSTSSLGLGWTVSLPAVNQAPRAGFTTSCEEGECTFDASSSTDDDGKVVGYQWDVDGVSAEGVKATYSRKDSGSFPVSLVVSDNSGATARVSRTVTVKVTPPKPAQPSTLYGMNVSPGSSFTDGAKETAADQVKRIVGTYGRLDVSKIFYTGMLPSTFNQSYEGQIPGKTVAVCFKPNQAQLANGSLDAAIKRYIDSIPEGWKVMLVNWQEPDDEMWKDKIFTVAQHRAATERLIDLARANPAYAAGKVEVWDVYMGYSLEVGRWQDAAASPRLDGIGWDYYWNKPTTHWNTDPSVMLKRMADVTKRIGISQYGLWETGDNPHPNDPTGVGRAGFWNRVYTSATELGYKHVIFFNAIGTTGDHRILPGTGFGDPTVAILKTWMNLR